MHPCAPGPTAEGLARSGIIRPGLPALAEHEQASQLAAAPVGTWTRSAPVPIPSGPALGTGTHTRSRELAIAAGIVLSAIPAGLTRIEWDLLLLRSVLGLQTTTRIAVGIADFAAGVVTRADLGWLGRIPTPPGAASLSFAINPTGAALTDTTFPFSAWDYPATAVLLPPYITDQL